MAYRYGNREQGVLFPESIEDYVSSDDPVRAYDVILGLLNFDKLGIKLDPHKVGCPEYDPLVMLKLLAYGYSYGIRSSRKLERATHHNVSFDPECTRINSVQGSHAGYNAQAVVDKKHGLIVSSDVVSENNDLNQFAEQINQANETLGKKCEIACADSGYANTDELEKIDEQEIEVVVPSQRQASEKEPKAFDKANFRYDSESDSYICPEGHELPYRHPEKDGKNKVYRITRGSVCRQCCHFGECTTSKNGRTVRRLVKEEIRQRLEAQYERPESQAVYKFRMQKVELPFGHIKRNLKVDSFLLRGREGAKAEMSLLASCFNITRMISIMGVAGLVERLMS